MCPFVQPTPACPNCWRAWLTGARDSIGYCWHGKIVWRVKSDALVVLPGVTREEHRAMLEYESEMEAAIYPTLSREWSDVSPCVP
jgi:hypothetical protein